MREISIAFQTDKHAARYIALAQYVDQFPFDAVSVYCDAPFQPSYGPLLLMAPHIRRARIGPAAIPPARIHPIDIAANTALLSDLAAGGVYVGLARGAWLSDHGIHEPQRGIQAIREAWDIVRYLLTGGQGGYMGEIYRLAAHVRAPYPLPERLPRLLIGSWGRSLCTLAGEIADEVKIGGTANPALIPVIAGHIAEGERRAGRPFGTVGIVAGAVTVVDDDRNAARAAARRSAALYLPVVAPLDTTLSIDPALIDRLRAHANAGEWERAAALISDDLLDRFAFSGDWRDLVRQCEALYAAGARRIEFGTPHGLARAEDGIRILGSRVIPALQSWRSS